MVLLDFAIDNLTGQLRYIDDVPNGNACNCKCPDCDELLVAYNNGQFQAHHFSHKSGNDHKINPMTRLHFLAEIIVSKSFHLQIGYDFDKKLADLNSSLQKKGLIISETDAWSGKSVILDSVCVGGRNEYTQKPDDKMSLYDVYFSEYHLAVEIYVTHRVPYEKKIRIQQAGDWCVELDLSNLPHNISYNDLEQFLSNYIIFDRHWIYGKGDYYKYILAIWKKYDDIYDDTLMIQFDFQGRMKYSAFVNLFDDYGIDTFTSEVVKKLTSRSRKRIYECMKSVNMKILPIDLPNFKIQLVMVADSQHTDYYRFHIQFGISYLNDLSDLPVYELRGLSYES